MSLTTSARIKPKLSVVRRAAATMGAWRATAYPSLVAVAARIARRAQRVKSRRSQPCEIVPPMKIRAAVLEEFGAPLRVQEVDLGEPRAGEVLVRLVACGVCHTD